ncbi:hypothetical protein MMC09_005325 [Bachmanniomyces sp. S44760]|nr:hypothetical protein [Bachmanniomyces sp. S44760]
MRVQYPYDLDEILGSSDSGDSDDEDSASEDSDGEDSDQSIPFATGNRRRRRRDAFDDRHAFGTDIEREHDSVEPPTHAEAGNSSAWYLNPLDPFQEELPNSPADNPADRGYRPPGMVDEGREELLEDLNLFIQSMIEDPSLRVLIPDGARTWEEARSLMSMRNNPIVEDDEDASTDTADLEATTRRRVFGDMYSPVEEDDLT